MDDTKEEGWAPGTCLLPQDRDCLAGYAIKGEYVYLLIDLNLH